MRFAAIVCPDCRRAWTVERRHETVTCPRCGHTTAQASRKPIWTGDDVSGAQEALTLHHGGIAALAASQRPPNRAARLPHDSAVAAAASRGTGIINKSERAEAVARALASAPQTAGHADLRLALEHAGLERERAESEIVRMLATDILMEPRAGQYTLVSA